MNVRGRGAYSTSRAFQIQTAYQHVSALTFDMLGWAQGPASLFYAAAPEAVQPKEPAQGSHQDS